MKSSDSLAWAVLGELICKAASCSCREHSLCWVQRASEVAQVIKSPPANAGDSKDMGLIPGSGRFPAVRNGNPLQYSCLENSMDRRAWWATVHGVTRSWTRLSNFHFYFSPQTTYLLFDKKLQDMPESKGKQSREIKRTSDQTGVTQMLELSDREFYTTMINMLRAVMEK